MPAIIIILLVILFLFLVGGVRILNQYERGVIFRLGKAQSNIKQPGLRIIIPFVDQMRKVIAIENVVSATYQIAQTTVRNIVGQSSLDDVLSKTSKINEAIKSILDSVTEAWGIYVSTVELKDIQLPEIMQSAMAAEAVAEREKRAKIIAAEGEQLSATKLAEAADIISKHPIALQLRNLQVLTEIASDKNSTIVFPAQFMDTVSSIKNFMSKESS